MNEELDLEEPVNNIILNNEDVAEHMKPLECLFKSAKDYDVALNCEDLEKNMKPDEVKSLSFNGKEVFKYIIIGTSVLVLKSSLYFLVENPHKLYEYLSYVNDLINFGELPKQIQLGLVFIIIVAVFFLCEKLYNQFFNQLFATKIYNLIRESFICDNNLILCDDDVVDIYSAEYNVPKEYFIKDILPEIKRQIRLDNLIDTSKHVYLYQNVENHVEVYTWKSSQETQTN